MRIKDPAALAEARRSYCEYCGITRGPFHRHHVKSVGSGGPDMLANLVNLCWLCHDGVHCGRIPRADIEALVEARENLRQRGLLACQCGSNQLLWKQPEGGFRCDRCDAEIRSIPAA